ncbi:hypothetical protein DW150_19805 [Phocaeicola vulgatus]|uniref:Uncharacterized protein n=1 Tax=Phocaeicola vulgatus TaxID=821 RepID=A0A415BII2_PHOVU|nr:hypothetical protein DW150_19805 [Phocaeicola vulgatus]
MISDFPPPPIIKVPSRCISASDIYRKLVTPLANWTCFFIVPRLRHRKKSWDKIVHKMYLDFISSNFMTKLSVSTMKCGHRKFSHGYTV